MEFFGIPVTLPTLIVLHLGLSVGWHIGIAMTNFEKGRKEGVKRRKLFINSIWKMTHHYDFGILMIFVGAGLLLGFPPIKQIVGFFLFGFGVGQAYDDINNHPPTGMTKAIIKNIRGK